LLFLPAHASELQPAERLYLPLLGCSEASLSNRHFRDREELEDVQFARCAVFQERLDLIRLAMLSPWWPKRIRKPKYRGGRRVS
jgi:hypothetical protein